MSVVRWFPGDDLVTPGDLVNDVDAFTNLVNLAVDREHHLATHTNVVPDGNWLPKQKTAMHRSQKLYLELCEHLIVLLDDVVLHPNLRLHYDEKRVFQTCFHLQNRGTRYVKQWWGCGRREGDGKRWGKVGQALRTVWQTFGDDMVSNRGAIG